jgi:hypothetical protein
LLRGGFVLGICSAVLLAGCTGGVGGALSFNKATLDDPDFSVTPDKGERDTVFKVDSLGLGDEHNVTWDWGDGTITYGATSEHKYGFTNGVMTITLIATAADGQQGIATKDVTLGTGENRPPTVSIRSSKTWIEVGQRINVSASGSDLDRDPITYVWTYAAEAAPAETSIDSRTNRAPVVFDAPGVYTVKVRALDPKGGESSANLTLTVSSDIPDSRLEQTFFGNVTAGSGGAGVSDKLWVASPPAPDTNVDAIRHRYTLDYPGYTLIFLTWNDTTQQGVIDLDLELRAVSNGTTVFKSETRAPAAPFEFNMTQQEPGEYDVIVRGVVGANVPYTVLVQSTLQITPELVLAREGQA